MLNKIKKTDMKSLKYLKQIGWATFFNFSFQIIFEIGENFLSVNFPFIDKKLHIIRKQKRKRGTNHFCFAMNVFKIIAIISSHSFGLGMINYLTSIISK